MVGSGAAEPTDEVDVIQRLVEEFADRIDRRTIRRVARQELALFDRSKVRTTVPAIAWRLARSRLEDLLTERTGRRSIAS